MEKNAKVAITMRGCDLGSAAMVGLAIPAMTETDFIMTETEAMF